MYPVLPSVIHGLIKSPPGEDESPWSWLAKTVGMSPRSGIPMAPDIAAAVEHGREYAFSPIEQMVNTFIQTGKDTEHAATGQPVSDRGAQHPIAIAGYTTGLPVGQATRTGEFLWDVHEGKQTPQEVSLLALQGKGRREDWGAGRNTTRLGLLTPSRGRPSTRTRSHEHRVTSSNSSPGGTGRRSTGIPAVQAFAVVAHHIPPFREGDFPWQSRVVRLESNC